MTETVQVPVSADTMVYEAYPTTTYGSAPYLTLLGDPELTGLLRFELPELAAGQVVTGARLQLRTTDIGWAGTSEPISVGVAGNAWDERTVTYDTRPALTGQVLGTLASATALDTPYQITLDPSRGPGPHRRPGHPRPARRAGRRPASTPAKPPTLTTGPSSSSTSDPATRRPTRWPRRRRATCSLTARRPARRP